MGSPPPLRKDPAAADLKTPVPSEDRKPPAGRVQAPAPGSPWTVQPGAGCQSCDRLCPKLAHAQKGDAMRSDLGVVGTWPPVPPPPDDPPTPPPDDNA